MKNNIKHRVVRAVFGVVMVVVMAIAANYDDVQMIVLYCLVAGVFCACLET